MRPQLPLALAAALVTSAAAFAAPTLPGPAFPNFADAKAVETACQSGLDGAAKHVKALEKHAPDAKWPAASDALNAYIEDVSNPIDLLVYVHPDKAIRDAAQACVLKWQDFLSTLGQNETLYKAAAKVKPRNDIDREFMRVTLDQFEDAGVSLPADKRARAKQIIDRITELDQQFNKNIRDTNTKVPFTAEELKGVPENVWKDKPRDDSGHYLLGLDYPTYLPVLDRADDAAARERIYRAKLSEGGEGNLKLLNEIVQLRREYAGLFGMKSYDDFQLRRRMSESTANTLRFLDDVKGAVKEGEAKDLAELREAKARHLGTPLEQTKLERWDWSYYTERVRQAKYAVDQDAFRQYFPPQESLQFIMKVAENMLGIKYTRVPAKLWHEDVQAYAVSDAKSGKPLATLLVDMYPRDGKYNHAAVWSYRNGSTLQNRVPQAAYVVNMDRKGLSLSELETMLHEMGHALHNNLSATRYAAQAGTSVKRDFVEAPSQMLEDWVYDKKVLKLFQTVCANCKPVPDELVDKAIAARDFGKGARFARQHLYASYDLALHSADAPEAMATWVKMEGATPLGHVQGTMFPAGFSHVTGGYGAGYYGYLYSLVVAMDLRTAFEANHLDPVVGGRYRKDVLSQGGQKPPKELVKNFLGRETNSKAFYDYLKK
ncbi:M3 family metallopeptidase [Piscinibacter terrae]|uniref:Peptidase n=1 Tax=Piscinibacter terrae TaxID=2496871 RepID=A0A3N7HQU7_9BURK|nr:M3 family metallopeptidase [Albitalea terrae]RQP23556.1 peptidase [Albitalea terrae]